MDDEHSDLEYKIERSEMTWETDLPEYSAFKHPLGKNLEQFSKEARGIRGAWGTVRLVRTIGLDKVMDLTRQAATWTHRGAVTETAAVPVLAKDQAEILKQERDTLFLQVQLLESRVAEERRRAEEAIREKDRIRSQLDKLLEAHGSTVEGNKELQRVLIAKDADSLKMIESFDGLVEHVHEDQVVVVYETEGDPIEHVYERDQFLDGHLPKVGERVIVSVFLASRSPQSRKADGPSRSESSEERAPRRRKNVIRGPHSF